MATTQRPGKQVLTPADVAAMYGVAVCAANLNHEIEIAEGYDTPASEEYEQKIIAALRPLVEDRRAAEARSTS